MLAASGRCRTVVQRDGTYLTNRKVANHIADVVSLFNYQRTFGGYAISRIPTHDTSTMEASRTVYTKACSAIPHNSLNLWITGEQKGAITARGLALLLPGIPRKQITA